MASSNHARRALLLAVALLPAAPALALDPQPPELVTRNFYDGEPSWGLCFQPRFAAGNRYLGFNCLANDLVPGDTNGEYDVFMLDRATGLIQRASLTSDGGQGEGYKSGSTWIVPAADGRQAAFGSAVRLHEEQPPAPFLAPGREAVFLRHFDTGITDLISRDAQGAPVNQHVRFMDAAPERNEVLFRTNVDLRDGTVIPFISHQWIRNWENGQVELVSARPDGELGNSSSSSARFSADGRYVVFRSSATDLGPSVRPGDVNIFVRDRLLGTTERVTYPYGGGEFSGDPVTFSANEPPRISADGRYVLFVSSNHQFLPPGFPDGHVATHVYLVDRSTGSIELISRDAYGELPPGTSLIGAMSADGRYVAYALRAPFFHPDPARSVLYVLDRNTGQRVDITHSLGPSEGIQSPTHIDLSADGSMLAFSWRASNPDLPPGYSGWTQIYTVDLGTGAPPAPPPAYQPVPTRSPWAMFLLAAAVLIVARRRLWISGE